MRKQINLLLSGGIDSTAVLFYYRDNGFDVRAYFVHYGHVSNNVEYECAKKVSHYYHTSLNLLRFTGARYAENWEITGRNAFFILAVLMAMHSGSGIISGGLHKGSDYYDSKEDFLHSMSTIIEGYTGGRVQLDFPFMKMTKNEIVAYSQMHKIPLNSTYSCQLGEKKPCGKCPSCIERKNAIEEIKNFEKEDKKV